MSDTNVLRPFAFVLAVPSIERSAAYFSEVLGFQVEWAEASDWRLVSRGAVRIMLGGCPNAQPPSQIGDHSYFGYMEVDDVDALYKEFALKEAILLMPHRSPLWDEGIHHRDARRTSIRCGAGDRSA